MGETVIKIENLYKEYRLGVIDTGYLFRDLQSLWARLRGKPDPNSLLNMPDFGNLDSKGNILALNDINLEVNQGEILGIIGRNGAGKSTLLKILSKVTAPTKGEIKIKGRVGSLLEVGTGFHPELTGKENIYLNGAILGMRKKEIDRKIDEIIAFAEIEKFVDTPVKRYSSGMYVRLAFAVAAYLDPEILVVDEVLAVGDAEFQKKCLGKMGDIAQGGRTVLFVSHNMDSIMRLSSRALLLKTGKVVMIGLTQDIVSEYLASKKTEKEKKWNNPDQAPGNDTARLLSVRVIDEKYNIPELCDIRKQIGIEMQFTILKDKSKIKPFISLVSNKGEIIFGAIDTNPLWKEPVNKGQYKTIAWIPGNLLSDINDIYVSVFVISYLSSARFTYHIEEREVIGFKPYDPHQGDSAKSDFTGGWLGAVMPKLVWEDEYQKDI